MAAASAHALVRVPGGAHAPSRAGRGALASATRPAACDASSRVSARAPKPTREGACAPRSNHARADCTTSANSPSARAAPNAAQQSAVVLMLLLLCTVSPQPPSAFCVRASHPSPRRIMSPSASRPSCASATTAVAVESALLESSPTQCPSAVSSPSSAAVARPSATGTSSLFTKRACPAPVSAPAGSRRRPCSQRRG